MEKIPIYTSLFDYIFYYSLPFQIITKIPLFHPKLDSTGTLLINSQSHTSYFLFSLLQSLPIFTPTILSITSFLQFKFQNISPSSQSIQLPDYVGLHLLQLMVHPCLFVFFVFLFFSSSKSWYIWKMLLLSTSWKKRPKIWKKDQVDEGSDKDFGLRSMSDAIIENEIMLQELI